MKRFIVVLLMLVVLTASLAAMSFYVGADAGAGFDFYMPYNLMELGGFRGKARFPIGGSLMMEMESFPWSLVLAGGWYPEVNISLEDTDCDMPYYAEVSALRSLDWPYGSDDSTGLRSYAGGGAGVWLNGIPAFNIFGGGTFIWRSSYHMYLKCDLRIDATFDFAAEDDGELMSLLQFGARTNVGVGFWF